MNTKVHFSSKTDLHATPQDFFDKLNEEFEFNLDVCAIPENAKCERYFTPEQDGLAQEWIGNCWMNPPYGRGILKWVRKAFESAQAGATVVCLLPARTDTAWWQDYVTKASDIRFVRGRLKFGDALNSAPFPSAVIVFRPMCEETPIVLIARERFSDKGNESKNSYQNEMLEFALHYASLGWPVLPLHTPKDQGCSCERDCGNSNGKHPRYHKVLIPNGPINATADSEIINQWWQVWPDANIGILTGAISGLVVLDIDPRNNGEKTIEKLQAQYGELPQSSRVRTGGGGWHLYLHHPGGRVKSTTIAPGVDVKADGGYVVAPPSLHASRRNYIWENENES